MREARVFCVQRGPAQMLAGMWEFPGGKVEPDELPPVALAREIDEELGCHIAVGDKVTRTVHEYDFATVDLTTYYCELIESEPTLSEHAASRWLGADHLADVAWAPADLPAVEEVIRHLEGRTKR